MEPDERTTSGRDVEQVPQKRHTCAPVGRLCRSPRSRPAPAGRDRAVTGV